MAEYWLDADVFIQAKDGPYGFEIAPGFWHFLDERSRQGVITSSRMVYDELVGYGDYLAQWVRSRRSLMFTPVDDQVQARFTLVAQYVTDRYPDSEAANFLRGADPWLIAHAMSQGGRVVTVETRVSPASTKPKIPNVCDAFDVDSLHYYTMLRDLGARFR